MSRIHRLDDVLINQIAAGEVVERPAAALKELLENALDAGATAISVHLREGGRVLLRVTDNGVGMDRDDAVLALERHATSKIRSFEDLQEVTSMGFRGEALPSIASVSQFQLLTRLHDQDVGTRVVVDGGKIVDVIDAGCAPGTEISVRNLFFNVPVRQKFMRTAATELSHCTEAMTRVALLHPDVDFQLFHDDHRVLAAPRVADPGARVRDLLRDAGIRLFPVQIPTGDLEIRGWISPIGHHFPSASGVQYLYVNGRYVRDVVLKKAVMEAYRGLIPHGRHPALVLELRLPPLRVDVNVHPSKVEVRFRDPAGVQNRVAEALREALRDSRVEPAAPLAPLLAPTAPPRQPPPKPAVAAHPQDDPRFYGKPLVPTSEASEPPSPFAALVDPGWTAELALPLLAAAPAPPPLAPQQPTPPLEAPPTASSRLRELTVLGVFPPDILIAYRPEALVLLDLIAARAAVLRIPPARACTPPLRVDLSRAAVETFGAHTSALEALSLTLAPLSPTAVAVLAAPSGLDDSAISALLPEISAALARGDTDAPRRALTRALALAAPAESPAGLRALLATLDEQGIPAERLVAALPRDELLRRLARTRAQQ